MGVSVANDRMRPNRTSHKFRPLSDWLWSVPLNASWYEFFMNYWELGFLLWHETINSCVKVSFPVMHCSHFYECCLPEPGLSCLLMNFCSYFICWIFTTSHCWFLASFLFVLPPLTQVQLCFSGISSLTMHKYRKCCPILIPPPNMLSSWVFMWSKWNPGPELLSHKVLSEHWNCCLIEHECFMAALESSYIWQWS